MPMKGLLRNFVRQHLPTRIKDHRILSGPLKGRRIVTSWRDYPAAVLGITEKELVGWFSAEVGAGETWLDVGAHYGYTAIALSSLVGRSGRVYAFEPIAATAGCISRTRILNGMAWLSVVPTALGDCRDQEWLTLRTVRGMADSVLDAETTGDGVQGLPEGFLVSRFDWLWERITGADRRVHGVKIDVQGMEYHVLRGMEELLKLQHPKLVIEFHKGVDRGEILSFLETVGYDRVAFAIEDAEVKVAQTLEDDRSYAFNRAV